MATFQANHPVESVKKLDRLIEKYSDKIYFWIDTINQLRKSILSESEYDIKLNIILTKEAVKTLIEISDLFIKFGSYKDQWDNGSYYETSLWSRINY